MNVLEEERKQAVELLKQTKEETDEKRQKKLFKHQVYMFLLCYVLWIGVHIQREFWAMSKRTIKQQNKNLSMKYFGTIDLALY